MHPEASWLDRKYLQGSSHSDSGFKKAGPNFWWLVLEVQMTGEGHMVQIILNRSFLLQKGMHPYPTYPHHTHFSYLPTPQMLMTHLIPLILKWTDLYGPASYPLPTISKSYPSVSDSCIFCKDRCYCLSPWMVFSRPSPALTFVPAAPVYHVCLWLQFLRCLFLLRKAGLPERHPCLWAFEFAMQSVLPFSVPAAPQFITTEAFMISEAQACGLIWPDSKQKNAPPYIPQSTDILDFLGSGQQIPVKYNDRDVFCWPWPPPWGYCLSLKTLQEQEATGMLLRVPFLWAATGPSAHPVPLADLLTRILAAQKLIVQANFVLIMKPVECRNQQYSAFSQQSP